MNYAAMLVAGAEELSALLNASPAFHLPGETPVRDASACAPIHGDVMSALLSLLTTQEKPLPQAYEAYARLVSACEGYVVPDRKTRGMYEDDHLEFHLNTDREKSFDMPTALAARMLSPLEDPYESMRGFHLWMTMLEMFRRHDLGGGRNSETRKTMWSMQQCALRGLRAINRHRRTPEFRAARAQAVQALMMRDNPHLIQSFISSLTQKTTNSLSPGPFTLPEWLTGPVPLQFNFAWKDVRVTSTNLGQTIAGRDDNFAQMRLEEQSNAFASELDSLIGLTDAKREFYNLNAVLVHEGILKTLNLDGKGDEKQGYHLLFTGPPGTAKTTLARMVGTLYRDLGILKKGHVVEVRRGDLVGEYIGHTAPMTRKVVEKAMDGVLFIDEAYELAGSDNDFGPEALVEIMSAMENKRDRLVVIMAGYPDAMQALLNTNAGLASRFRGEIPFPAYTLGELMEIFDMKSGAAGLRITDDTREAVRKRVHADMSEADENKFGNGRYIRSLVHGLKEAMAVRLFRSGALSPVPSSQAETQVAALRRTFQGNAQDILRTPLPEDVRAARVMEKVEGRKRRPGFAPWPEEMPRSANDVPRARPHAAPARLTP